MRGGASVRGAPGGTGLAGRTRGRGSIIDINGDDPYDATMRTTLTIDDDIVVWIDERRRDGQSLKQVINALLREGLRSDYRTSRAKRYRTKTHELRLRSGFDAAGLNQLVDEVETETDREREARRRA